MAGPRLSESAISYEMRGPASVPSDLESDHQAPALRGTYTCVYDFFFPPYTSLASGMPVICHGSGGSYML